MRKILSVESRSKKFIMWLLSSVANTQHEERTNDAEFIERLNMKAVNEWALLFLAMMDQ